MHIKKIELLGFRRFTHLTITDLPQSAKLVVLAGPNGNGKSSLFDAFVAHHHAQLSGFGFPWDADYHVKRSDASNKQQHERIRIEFHETFGEMAADRRKAFYVRSAYRNDPDFQVRELRHTPAAIDQRRLARLIDNDVTVLANYQRLASLAVAELYGDSNDSRTFGDFRAETRGQINKALQRLLPDLSLTDLGRPLERGTFFFTKGASKNFPYMNLSGGEKAVFDMLLDIVVNRHDFDNTVYAIDEPESHLNPRLQGELLRVLYEVMPIDCQLWLATHAIGMLRAARDLAISSPGTVLFLDFDKNFDEPHILRPEAFNRAFWERSLSVAFADMAALVAPRMIIRCEGSSTAAAGDGFDAQVYEIIFGNEFPDVRFVSSGASNDLEKDISLVTAAIEGKVPGLTFKKLFDRDDRSLQEIQDAVNGGDRVLSRRQIESYLFDDEVLTALAHSKGRPTMAADLIAARNAALSAAHARGRPIDDMKSAAGETFVAVRKILQVTQGGNTARSFMRDTLAPLVTPTMKVYLELKQDIFGQA